MKPIAGVSADEQLRRHDKAQRLREAEHVLHQTPCELSTRAMTVEISMV